MQDEYMSARAADTKDIGDRILRHLYAAEAAGASGTAGIAATSMTSATAGTSATAAMPGVFNPSGSSGGPGHGPFGPDTILIADDITPSDTITMDTSQMIGFATRTGSRTSHAAIIARARGLPAVVGCGDNILLVADDDVSILDGQNGLVLINPDKDLLAEYQVKKMEHARQDDWLAGLKDIMARTTDGEVITLLANIGEAKDLDLVFDKGGEGTGLLRTELLFMDRPSFPTEEEQFEFYKEIILRSGINLSPSAPWISAETSSYLISDCQLNKILSWATGPSGSVWTGKNSLSPS